MSIFALKFIEEVVVRIRIFKLVVDNHCEYDEFESQIENEARRVNK
jgi:hypothetical protein